MEDQAPGNIAAASATPSPLPPPPGRQVHDLYIVQFPKDQVYRIPPRENAAIVEQYRKPAAPKKVRRVCCCSRRTFITLAIILIAIVAIVGITLATLYFIFSPKGPRFSVSNVEVKNDTKISRPQFAVLLKATNPNERLGIDYESGDVSVMLGNKKVVGGKFPTMEQGRGKSNDVKVELSGYNGALPNVNAPLVLKLEMNLKVRVTTAGLRTWVMRSNVFCDVKVDGLRNDTRVLSQRCRSNFKEH